MSQPTATFHTANPSDEILARVLEEITREVEAGLPVDPAKYEAKYPQYADRIRELVPAAEALRELGLSFIRSSRSGSSKLPHAGFSVSGTLGDFCILREIGRGGMGVVYEAEQVSLGRRLALKVLPFAATLDPRHLQRFRNEAQAAAALKHPHIVGIHSVGCERGVYYYAMELIEGRTLAQVIDDLRKPCGAAATAPSLPATTPLDKQQPENAAPSTPEPRTLNPARQILRGLEDFGSLPSPQPLNSEPRTANPDLQPLTPDLSPAADTQREAFAADSTKGPKRPAEFFRTAAQLGLQAAEALEHAHQSGVVHRDIKPSNLMVDARGQLWITDFGLAMTQGDAALTMTGDILGTLRYMSPEQALGNRREMDHRTDIYSLGVTLYELLALRPAFAGGSRQTLVRRLLEEDPPPPRSVNPAVPRDLETIVLKAMAKEPSQRYATAQQLADDLKRFLADEPIRARRPSLADHAAKWARRHRPVVGFAITLLVLGTIGSLVSTVLIDRERSQVLQAYKEKAEQLEATERAEKAAKQQEELAKQQESLAKQQQQLAIAQRKEAVQQRDAAKWNLYLAQMRLAQQDYRAGQTARLREMLDSYLPQADQADLRGWEWFYLLSLCHSELLALCGHAAGTPFACWNPAGRQFASCSHDGTVKIWDAITGREIRTLSGDRGGLSCVAWSPDGRKLASSNPDLIRIWDPLTGHEARTILRHVDAFTSLAWGPDSLRLAEGDGKEIKIWHASTGQSISLRVRTDRPPDTVNSVAWSPDGRYLACGAGFPDAVVKILDASSGREESSLRGHDGSIVALAWTPDAHRLASASYDQTVKVWDTSTGREIRTLSPLNGWVQSVSWSPDGRQLALSTHGSTVQVWDASTGARVRGFHAHTGPVWCVAWSPDGKRLISTGDDQLRVWDAGADPEVRTLRGHTAIVRSVAFSPDGRQLASAASDKKIILWDAATGREIRVLDRHAAELRSLAWGPGGKLASADTGGTIKVWDAATGKDLLTWEGPRGNLIALAWSPDGHLLASADDKPAFELWNAATGAKVRAVQAHPTCTRGVRWSCDGRQLASAGDDAAVLWNPATWEKIATIQADGSSTGGLAWSPDGRRLAVTGHSAIHVWDTVARASVFRLRGHTGVVISLAWHPHGKRLASSAEEGAVKIWDLGTGQEILTLQAGDKTREVAWSPDGRRLAGASGQNVQIWDASVGYEMAARPEDLDRAQRLLNAGSSDEAIAMLQKLADEFPRVEEYRKPLAKAYFSRGDKPFHQGDLEKAFPDLDRAIQYDPGCSEAYDHRGFVHLRRGDLDKAIADYDQAIRFGPAYPNLSYPNRAAAYLAKGNLDKANADLMKAIEVAPDSAFVWYHRALAQLSAGRLDEYRKDCAEMLRRCGQTDDAGNAHWTAWTCALTSSAVADWPTAVALAEKAAKSDSKSVQYATSLGAVLCRAGRLEEAIQRLEEADRLVPHPSEKTHTCPAYVWFLLAMSHQRLGHAEQAKNWYAKAAGWTDNALRGSLTDPRSPPAWNRRLTLNLFRAEAAQLLGIPENPSTAKEKPQAK